MSGEFDTGSAAHAEWRAPTPSGKREMEAVEEPLSLAHTIENTATSFAEFVNKVAEEVEAKGGLTTAQARDLLSKTLLPALRAKDFQPGQIEEILASQNNVQRQDIFIDTQEQIRIPLATEAAATFKLGIFFDQSSDAFKFTLEPKNESANKLLLN